ncbi:MAG: aminopeptidase P family protein, partial [Bacteroidia bacterium]|nr:aminopeptidase P family protein [Bacteroidia bacterium]
FFPFKQHPDLYYLSGIDQEMTVLLICPDFPIKEYREVLFLRKTNEHIAVWEGHKYTMPEAEAASGIKTIKWVEDFNSVFSLLANHSENIYVDINENDRYASEVEDRNSRFANAYKLKYPGHNFERSGQIMADLRRVKSKHEVEQIQTACNITEKGLRRILRMIKPGVNECEIEAEITHEFLINRATGHAYSPIIASGPNACVLHYVDNNLKCNAGDVILMDFGAEYANYAADLTRCVPVSGKFTKRQKDVYNAVHKVMKASIKMLKPGNTIDKYHKAVGELMTKQLVDLKLLKMSEVKKQDAKSPLYKKYFMHGTSHFLGLDVHDVGDRFKPMQVGNVFTCEPGIYIPEENLGIRLENDILITAKGQKDLMKNIPINADEIEDLMN